VKSVSDNDGLLGIARVLAATTPNVFWLDSGPGATIGRSYVGSGRRVLTARDGRVRVDGEVVGGDALSVLDALLGEHRDRPERGSGPARADSPRFRGGWVGVLGYEYGAALVGAPTATGDLPDALFVECDRLWSLDHATGRVELLLGEPLDAGERARADAAEMADAAEKADASGNTPASENADATRPFWRHDRAAYTAAIRSCLSSIGAGDAYQLCLTNEVRVPTRIDAFAAYLDLRRTNPAPHGGFLRIGDVAIAGSSPERFLSVSADGRAESRPIKGTRRRDADPFVDAELARELRADEKERAENLMIVDLVRNDLGRVADLGTVDVPDLFAVESYPSVHQLVSTVTATLAPGITALDAVRAAFPAGSMTGTPKHRAMTILHELEGGPRGLYAGAMGWLGADGALDLAMVIRSVVFTDGVARIGTGGGITALSDPAREVDETELKARALLAVLGASATLPDGSA
jgi:para-aminobenzoate synthetase component 1